MKLKCPICKSILSTDPDEDGDGDGDMRTHFVNHHSHGEITQFAISCMIRFEDTLKLRIHH